jgi:hypothetical protein
MKMTEEVKAERREARKQAKRVEAKRLLVEQAKRMKPVKSIVINIEWIKSRMWGSNPRADATIIYKDGTRRHAGPFTTSGCGYDKESTVIAKVFNDALLYKLFQVKRKAAPYGIYYYKGKQSKDGWLPTYNGGVGTSCYYDIAEFIGGKFEKIASGKTFDAFQYTNKSKN